MRPAPWIVLAALLAAAPAGAQPPPPPPPLQPLPAPPQPAGNPVTPAKAMLGKALFWDEQLSSTSTVACGTCHRAGSGGSDPRSSLPNAANATNPGPDGVFGTPDDIVGSPGVVLNDATGAYLWSGTFGARVQVTPRLAPAHINAAYGPQLFWDGRASGTFVDPLTGATVLAAGAALESQAAGPPVADVEMAHTGRDWLQVALRVAASAPLALAANLPADLAAFLDGRDYPALFADAFGSADVTPSRIVMAIASYERTLVSNRTPFDSTIVGTAVLTPQENAGRQLFGQLPCASCHAGALMSDNQFHYIGVRPAAEDAGRMIVTHLQQDQGAMKTPSLRNVQLRRSYMHDGRFHTLAEVVAFYNRGGDFNAPNKDPRIVPLNLTPQQQASLVAFLSRPLVDPRVAAESAPFDRPTLFTESGFAPQLVDGGVAGALGVPQAVALEPALAGNPRFTVAVAGAPSGAEAILVVDDTIPAPGAAPTTGSFARRRADDGHARRGFGHARDSRRGRAQAVRTMVRRGRVGAGRRGVVGGVPLPGVRSARNGARRRRARGPRGRAAPARVPESVHRGDDPALRAVGRDARRARRLRRLRPPAEAARFARDRGSRQLLGRLGRHRRRRTPRARGRLLLSTRDRAGRPDRARGEDPVMRFALVLFLVPGLALAQPPERPHGPPPMERFEALKLTDTQKTKIEALHDAERRKTIRLDADVRIAEMDSRTRSTRGATSRPWSIASPTCAGRCSPPASRPGSRCARS
jgi:cytochrome c peroxidase